MRLLYIIIGYIFFGIASGWLGFLILNSVLEIDESLSIVGGLSVGGYGIKLFTDILKKRQ
ncbi:MAG: hypothetical protein CMO46_06485 [Verrucomicrobiales bacterium]|nr:hypothetical protein [Verrucomicrobiales bacterium]MBD28118.1 hypothetical protein [Verrucomicrobiaceae bacterium]MBV63700.1 hypothetical protein [Rickettsiales bacterium]